MTREQIEKAAMRYAVGNSWYPGETSYKSDIKAMEESFADAFKAGAQWRINVVWHDINEEPKEHKLVLLEDDFCGEFDYSVWETPFPNWKESIVHSSPKRWAYISDILPERKEKTE